jgi:hypothetical protein
MKKRLNGLTKIVCNMKKGIEWFAYLSEQEQKEFRENCKDFHEYIQEEYFSFRAFISLSFDWIDTPQGNDYWMEISNREVQ